MKYPIKRSFVMKKTWWLGVIIAIFLVLTTLQTTTDENEEGTVRYYPNGAEPVYVGIFGE